MYDVLIVRLTDFLIKKQPLSTLSHKARYSVNEFLSLRSQTFGISILHIFGNLHPLYGMLYSLFSVRGKCTHVPSIHKMLVC